MAILSEILPQIILSLMILGIGTWIFCLKNRRRPIPTETVDPNTGERKMGERWERGTRRSRWQGYCVIGGAILGNQVCGVLGLIDSIRSGAVGPSIVTCESGLCGMTVGLLAGLAVGTFSSQFLPEHSRLPDPDEE